MTEECPICLQLIDESQYAIINNEGENGKYHLHDLVEWFTTRKTGIMTQSDIETYSIFEKGEHTQTINVSSHYSELKVFMNDVENDINTLWNSDTSVQNEEDEEYDDIFFCC